MWARLALVMALVAIPSILIVGLVAVDISTATATADAQRIVRREAQTQAEFVGTWVNDQLQVLRGWTEVYRISELDNDRRRSLLRSVFVAVPSVVNVALVDLDGVALVEPVYLSTPPEARSTLYGRHLSSAERAEALIKHLPLTETLDPSNLSRTHVGQPYHLEGSRNPALPVAVTGPYGEPVVLGAQLSLDAIADLGRSSDPDHGVALLDGDGRPLLGQTHRLVEPALLRSLLRLSADIDDLALPDGERVIGATAPVPLTDWTMVVVVPTAVALASADQIRRRTGQVLLVAVVGVLLLSLLTAQSVAAPVRALRDSVLAVADGDLGRQTRVSGSLEVGELARAFNQLSQRLSTNRSELRRQREAIEGFNQELQHEVERRTTQLREAQAGLVRSEQLAAVAEVGAGLAHELNNPLAGILGTAQLLRARGADPALDLRLAEIESEACRCAEVVEAITRLTASGVDRPGSHVVDLRHVLRDVSNLVRDTLQQRGVELVVHEATQPLPVRLDRVQAGRLFTRLLHTLHVALPPGAQLQVRAELEGDEVIVRLEPDQALSAARRDDLRAQGVSLWVSRRLLDGLGGRLEDDGVAWRIVLPQAVEAPE